MITLFSKQYAATKVEPIREGPSIAAKEIDLPHGPFIFIKLTGGIFGDMDQAEDYALTLLDAVAEVRARRAKAEADHDSA